MADFKGRYWLVFDQQKAREPILCSLARNFLQVTFNLRHASVSDGMGVIALELEGDRSDVKKAVAWLESNGIQVDPVELQTIEG